MRVVGITLLAAVALGMAGCSDKAPAPQDEPERNAPAPAAPEPAPAPPPPVELPKTAPPAETNDSAQDDTPPDESAQTQEDADATGMTTRAPPPITDEAGPVANTQASSTGEQ